MRYPENIDLPEPWEAAAREAGRCRGAVMVIGASDVGKSTLVQHLTESLLKIGRRVALVDCDVGQSTLGPPAAISMARIEEATVNRDALRPEKMRFVGSISPAGHILEAVVGAGMMVQKAHQSGAELVIVDTDGMVQGHSAVQLKYNQVALINPALVLALQREAEIEPLLASLSGIAGDRLRRLPASALAQAKTYSEKRNNRRLRFLNYFRAARMVALDLGRVALQGIPLGMGRKLPPEEAEFVSGHLNAALLHAEMVGDSLFLVVKDRGEGGNPAAVCERYGVRLIHSTPLSDYRNRLVGLSDGAGDCLALGTVKGINFASKVMEVNAPLSDDALPTVKLVQFGSLKVEPTGEEKWITRGH